MSHGESDWKLLMHASFLRHICWHPSVIYSQRISRFRAVKLQNPPPKRIHRINLYHEPPKPWKIKVFRHLKTMLFTVKSLQKYRFGGPMVGTIVLPWTRFPRWHRGIGYLIPEAQEDVALPGASTLGGYLGDALVLGDVGGCWGMREFALAKCWAPKKKKRLSFLDVFSFLVASSVPKKMLPLNRKGVPSAWNHHI